jgi:hypothetical protein
MKTQTPEFVDREVALDHSDKLLSATAAGGLAIHAEDGMGKSFLLREIALGCKAAGTKAIWLETSRAVYPNYWTIIRRIADQWPANFARTTTALDEIESKTGPLEQLPGGGLLNLGTVNVQGDLVAGAKLAFENDASAGEYRGLQEKLKRQFFLDLSDLCGGKEVVTLLFDNVDMAPQDTSDWLALLLGRLWSGDWPGLRVLLAAKSLPQALSDAAGSRFDTLGLSPFTEENVAQYFRFFGLPEGEAQVLFAYTQGRPAILNMLVKTRLHAQG